MPNGMPETSVGAAQRYPGHRLDTAGDGDVVPARDHPGRGEFGGLLGRTALAVDGGRGDPFRPACRQDGAAPDVVRLLTNLTDAAPDHVVHPAGVDTGALGKRL